MKKTKSSLCDIQRIIFWFFFRFQKMRRNRQGRLINWTLIFVIYCSIQVYSAGTKPETIDDTTENEVENDFSSTLSPNVNSEGPWASTKATNENQELTTPSPTLRAKRINCTPPAIEQFPRPLMPPGWRKNGGLVVNVIIALFTFLGLAIVCDDYFVSSLDRICEGMSIYFENRLFTLFETDGYTI